MKTNTIGPTDVSPTNFNISLNERKAIEDIIGVLDFDLQSHPWVSGYGMEEDLQGICI